MAGAVCYSVASPASRRQTAVVLGAGNVDTIAARLALGMGHRSLWLDINPRKLRAVDEALQGRLVTMIADDYNIPRGHCICGPGHWCGPGTGRQGSTLITREMLRLMRPGAVIVDVAIDQGVAWRLHVRQHT